MKVTYFSIVTITLRFMSRVVCLVTVLYNWYRDAKMKKLRLTVTKVNCFFLNYFSYQPALKIVLSMLRALFQGDALMIILRRRLYKPQTFARLASTLLLHHSGCLTFFLFYAHKIHTQWEKSTWPRHDLNPS